MGAPRALVAGFVAASLGGCHALVGIEERGAGGDDANGPSETQSADASTTGATSADATTSTGPPSLYETAVITSMPTVFFRFEEDAGDVIDTMDGPGAIAYSFEGGSTMGGSKVERGVSSGRIGLGKAIRFHGATDGLTGGYVLLADASPIAFDQNRPFSVEYWAALQIVDNVTAYPISCAFVTDSFDIQGYWTELGKQNGVPYASASRGAGTSFDRVFVQPFDPSDFHHYVHTYDGTRSVFFVDGVERDACVAPGCPNAPMGEASTWIFTIGGGWNGADADTFNGGFANGVIDEVAIYAHALQQAEIQLHFQAASFAP